MTMTDSETGRLMKAQDLEQDRPMAKNA